jgi:DNA-binding transcriptional ArsR family regulator
MRATVFAALGDETRLAVLAKLLSGEPQSISRLTEGTRLTRQAVTKHLHVLESAGVVRSMRAGREALYELQPRPIDEARAYLDHIAQQWDDALARLKAFAEG